MPFIVPTDLGLKRDLGPVVERNQAVERKTIRMSDVPDGAQSRNRWGLNRFSSRLKDRGPARCLFLWMQYNQLGFRIGHFMLP